MKKIIFKVSKKGEENLLDLIKDINSFSCRIKINLEENAIVVENLDNTAIDNVIDLVNNYYKIVSIEVDTTKQREVNDGLENLLKNLAEKVSWAIEKKDANPKEVGEYLLTASNEISMKYGTKQNLEVFPGDIVDCNYGAHLGGEISGYHVPSLVCNTLGDLVYVVPISTTSRLGNNNNLNLELNELEIKGYKKNGKLLVLIEKGKYLRIERIHGKLGEVIPEFFARVLNNLAFAFDFRRNIDISKIKVDSEEVTLLDYLDTVLKKIEVSNLDFDSKLNSFLNEIGLPSGDIMKQTFKVACTSSEMNLEAIIREVEKANPKWKHSMIKKSIQMNFKFWTEHNPEIAEKCPGVSMLSVLKIFANRI